MADEEIPVNELLVDVEDGIVVGLYHYLWLKDGKGRPCPEVNIPHTIIYANGRPVVWYFTSGKDRCIKRKHKSTISNPAINAAFAPSSKTITEGYGGETSQHNNAGSGWGGLNSTAPAGTASQKPLGNGRDRPALSQTAGGTGAGNGRPMDGSSTGTALGPWPHHGVVGRFQGSMTLPHTASSASGHNARPGSPSRRKKGGITVELVDEAREWFSRETLREVVPPGAVVVHGVAALHEGVLQKFVQPRGQHYFLLRATWSPNACVVERRTAKSKINDPRVPLSERLAGFDSPVWMSEHTLITGTVLQGTVGRMCDNIAAHLADVSKGEVRVLRMVLYFAVDEANRIWLTHASTLRTQRPREEAVLAGLARGNSQRQHGSGGGAGPHHHPHHAIQHQHSRHQRALDVGGGAGSEPEPGAGLDLPAPSPAFASTRPAAGEGGDEDGAGSSGRFLCVLTGEMYPGSSRCDVTYKQLLQHWFSLASQLPNEGDRLRAMDTIPLAIRRANPSLTREWYLRVRSQPNFLYRTAPVCAEAAGQLTGVALEELQRTMAGRPGTTSAAVAAMSGVGLTQAASVSGAQPLGRLVAARTGQGSVSQGGGFGAGLAGTGRPRPVTALAAMLPPPPPPAQSQQARPPSRQHQSTSGGGGKAPAMRSKSASAALAARMHAGGGGGGFVDPLGLSQSSRPRAQTAAPSRYGPNSSAAMVAHYGSSSSSTGPGRSSSQGQGQGRGLPSMLVPRDKGAGAGRPGSALLQAYGPTPEQAAEAAAAAAALPYEVLDQQASARQRGEGLVGGLPSAILASEHAANGITGAGSAAAQAGPGGAGVSQGAAGTGGEGSAAQVWTTGSGTSQFRSAPPPALGNSRRSAMMRMSTCSDATEVGSNHSLSEPTSPNGTPLQASGGSGQAYHPHHLHHGHVSGSGGSPGGGSSSAPATRMSPPRSTGLLTLQTIHEEGATAPPPSRAGDPRAGLGDADVYPPPTRGSGAHSVPRMRPPARGGSDRPPAPGASGPSRRQMPYPYSGSTAVAHRSLSESGELQAYGGGGGSLNSTMASSVSIASRRSTSTQALLSNDDVRTLRELNEAYSAAERLTQQLLAQAHEILSDEGSRPPSTGTSPHRPPHGAGGAGGAQRRPSNTMLSPPTSLPNSRPGSRHGRNGDGSGSAPSAYTSLMPPPSSGQAVRPGSSSGPQPPSRQQSVGAASTGSGAGGGGAREAAGSVGSTSGGRPPGLPPAGQRLGSTNLGRSPLSQVSRTSSGRRPGSVGSNDGSTLEADSGSHAGAQASGLARAPSTSGHAVTEAMCLAGGLAQDGGVELEEDVRDSGPMAAPATDLFTSAEAELLTEALQD
ncbi:hypothetical protein HYH02_015240 [Chlamydomonas schloesseri]|uniref:Uncharacterized protein n=1 Tax=Chlamydomonas schloesseri TaxID=2026947 RepID=A0A835SBR8_9CHLO|nr:hypothetical protein HYH02_015240 [Chlamydomonas schloesseri]|eukprot:KAG2424059.1 hypothetical protein HYH02_015240 [Chlamydomonas schloesseri]